MKRLLLILAITILFIPEQGVTQASVSIDHVDGLYDGKIKPGTPLKFHIRLTNNTGSAFFAGQPSFRVYLSNNNELINGMFEPIVLDTLPLGFPNLFDFFFSIIYYSADGIGADTVTFGGAVFLSGSGLPNGFDGLVANISTSVSADFAGDSLCIDSSFAPPSIVWKWALFNGSTFIPDWSGPYCYEILPSCCIGFRGNANNSSDDFIDVSDLNYMVSYMFLQGPLPECFEEIDVDGDGALHISDLVDLVSYMFLGGTPPADCQ